MTPLERFRSVIDDIPVAHRIVIGTAIAALLMLAVMFARWVAAPTYTVLYANLDESTVASVIDELEGQSVPYQLSNGGSTVMVPKKDLYTLRASLAGKGIASSSNTLDGYEILQGGTVTTSQFMQQVDFKRAMEGELAKTLMAFDHIETASVMLVLPEDELFREADAGAKASVLLGTRTPLSAAQVETIAFFVSSSIEGLAAQDITIADRDGRVLNVPGELAGAATLTDRNLRMTRELEATLAASALQVLDTAIAPGHASVVVNATLDFDERERESETFAPESQVALRQQTESETYEGSGAPIGGVVGVDGGPLEGTDGETTSSYDRNQTTTEFGVDRVVDKSREAPGDIVRLSVAVVMDDGSVSGLTPPTAEAVQNLVAAAIGIDAARGDTIVVEAIPFAATPEAAPAEAPTAVTSLVTQLPQYMGVLILALVSVALLRMSRKKKPKKAKKKKGDEDDELLELDAAEEPAALPSTEAAAALGAGAVDDAATPSELVGEPAAIEGEVTAPVQEPALVGAGASGSPLDDPIAALLGPDPSDETIPASVAELVERQPEEIALLLRSWLADEGGR